MTFDEKRYNTATMLLQAMIETEGSWAKRVADDVTYKHMVKHAVKMTDALLRELDDVYC